MRRQLTLAVLAGSLSLTALTAAGAIGAGAAVKVPPACVTHSVGKVQVEVGYCPNGPSS